MLLYIIVDDANHNIVEEGVINENSRSGSTLRKRLNKAMELRGRSTGFSILTNADPLFHTYYNKMA